MMRIMKNIYFAPTFILAVLLIATSCSEMDEFKKYVQDGEISYTGKIDSVRIYAGKERVRILGLFMGDPKIKELHIMWNGGRDSFVVPVERSQSVDTLDIILEVNEGVKNFQFLTFDEEGNRSVPVNQIGTSYGKDYQSILNHRPVRRALLDNGLTIQWEQMDLTTGAFATEVQYIDENQEAHSVITPMDSTETLIEVEVVSDLKYRTLFLPEENCIDTFHTDFIAIEPEVVYLRNLGFPFERESWDGSRWGVLAEWTTSDDVKNSSGNGGYELRGGAGVLSMEGGWGLPAVPNGKIYQTVMLPAGHYTFEPSGIEAGSAGDRYVVVAAGSVMPDVADVASSPDVIAYATLSPANSGKVEFDLTEPTEVSIGFVANMPDTGSYFKVKGIHFIRE